MAGFDSVGTGYTTASGSVITWPHTVVSNSDGVILASLGANTTGSITSLKFAGAALTKIIGGTNGASGGVENELWYLLNPPTGLGTFNGTYSATFGDKGGISLAYTGINQATPIFGSGITVGTAQNSGSVEVALQANNWLVGAYFVDGAPGTTGIGVERGTPAGNGELMGADSTGGTLEWARGSGNFTIVAAELNAAAAVASAVGYRSLLGVGI